jgi:hypothetical protein
MGRPGDRRRELLNSANWPASDDALVDALIGFANGAEVVMLTKPREGPATIEEKRAHPRAPLELRNRFVQFLRLSVEDPALLHDQFMASIGMKLLASMKVSPVVNFGTYGVALGCFWDFPDLESALSFGVSLLLDARKPYGKALHRCKLPTCDRFYLARKNPKGGPANLNYCSPGHRDIAHDSREHRATMKAARRHK